MKELATELGGMTTARDVWKQKFKEYETALKVMTEYRDSLQQSLDYEKMCRTDEQRKLNDVTSDRDRVMALCQEAEKNADERERARALMYQETVELRRDCDQQTVMLSHKLEAANAQLKKKDEILVIAEKTRVHLNEMIDWIQK